MKEFKLIILVNCFFLLVGCNKDAIETPVNQAANEASIGCATCPSTFHPLEVLVGGEETLCDDITDTENWTSGLISDGDTIGYTQDNSQPVINNADFSGVNGFNPGIYGVGPIKFDFNGSNQSARFNIYGFYEQYNEMGFTVNGSAIEFMDATFPIVLSGVTVDLDTNVSNVSGFGINAHLTFTGIINTIDLVQFESGVVELCVTRPTTGNSPVQDTTANIYFTDFINQAGVATEGYPNQKTPTGYYGNQGASMVVKFDKFLAYSPTKIGFVYARVSPSVMDLINVKLPSSDLIATTPDSLAFYLSPFGYNVEIITNTAGLMWTNETAVPTSGARVDSILITGNSMNKILVGAQLTEGELRSVCSYYE